MHKMYCNWNVVLWAPAIVALGCLGSTPRSAQAQNSVAGWPEREDFKQEPSKVIPFNTRATVLRNGTFASDEEEQKFTDFYKLSLFPNVTWYKAANRQSANDVIVKLLADLKACEPRQDRPAQVYDKLADLTLAYMTKIAGDDQYHPVARVNAMLAIGEINSPKAAQVLLATALNSKQVFAVRVAAMTGLVRMAGPSGRRVLSDPVIAPMLAQKMVAFVKYHAPKRDDGICWMRGQAADLLADMGDIGSQGEVPPALLTMLNDKDLPIPLRSKAARALGKLNYGDNQPAAGPYLAALAEFARDAFSPDQPADRGRVRLVFRDVEDGRKKFASSTRPNDQGLISGLKKTLDDLNKETADKMTPEDLKASIKKAKDSLDGLLKNKR